MRTKIRKILQGRKNVQTAPNSFLIKQCNILSQSNVLLEFLGMRKDKNINISVIYIQSSKHRFKSIIQRKILVIRSILTSTDYFVRPSVKQLAQKACFSPIARRSTPQKTGFIVFNILHKLLPYVFWITQ